ncbi:hypothetical protein EYV94_10395 [Puteibacter caeruleilacunae]|nr:hypothetical protein EYV94_10395 [Puteibacter caeruleilacunae]
MKVLELLIKSLFWCFVLYIFSSCNVLKKGMSSREYHNYLREDTVVCELNTFAIEPVFESVLYNVIEAWENCSDCKEDPHPFIFEIEEKLQNDTLTYSISTNASFNIAHHFYSGAFNHEGYLFAVVEKCQDKSSFVLDEKMEPTKIYFCDRIHHLKYDFLMKCQCINESCKVLSIDYKEAESIMIK